MLIAKSHFFAGNLSVPGLGGIGDLYSGCCKSGILLILQSHRGDKRELFFLRRRVS